MYHMEEQTRRAQAGPEHVLACGEKLRILQRQRSELCRAVLELIEEYAAGSKTPALYAQFKMYNDPGLNPELYARGAE
jgi:hypothetical protein